MHLPGDVEESSLNYYRIGPLLYVTEMLLPELPAAEPADRIPGQTQVVTIRFGEAPASLTNPALAWATCEATASDFLLRIQDVAVYHVRKGAEVIVQVAPGAPEVDVRSYLMGSVFAALCHQRGLLPLHASAIATPHGAVAFLGNSGDGKSSLAAFLARRGHRVVADDIFVIDPAAPRSSRVVPVAPWLKLWNTTLHALGKSSEGLQRTFVDEDKYRYDLREGDERTPLAEIILLERIDPGDAQAGKTPVFERLAPAHALRAVLNMTSQSWLMHALGETGNYFLHYGKALDGVRVTRMRRPWGFDAMEATLNALEAHLATLSGP